MPYLSPPLNNKFMGCSFALNFIHCNIKGQGTQVILLGFQEFFAASENNKINVDS
jgi:hypothetical protein